MSETPRFCVDCRFHQQTKPPFGDGCRLRVTTITCLVTGLEVDDRPSIPCSDERYSQAPGKCGLAGIYFEPKESL